VIPARRKRQNKYNQGFRKSKYAMGAYHLAKKKKSGNFG